MKEYALVGDVGGTNVRLALCEIENGNIIQNKTFSTRNYDSLENLIDYYLTLHKYDIKHGCIAIACPIIKDWIEMTNHNWAFSKNTLQKQLNFSKLEIINDFTAVSMAIPMLKNSDILQLGGKKKVHRQPIAIYGAGTGLGVSHLIQVGNYWVTLPGEGGHVDFCPNSEEESNILRVLRDEIGHVSAERILSGIGLVNIYRAIAKLNNCTPEHLKPQDVSERALSYKCLHCRKALSLFCILMGRFGGNLALNLGTFGGVYIAGGIVPRFLEFFKKSGFRAAFEDKGRFKEYLLNIPVYMITHDQPGLLGAGAYLRQQLGYIL